MMSNIHNHNKKKIIHIDMDSFFAAVEIRDNPALANKPVAVGGQPDKRGVIATSNYIARQYGVHSAMSTAKALMLCPKLVVLYPNIAKYKIVSNRIRNILLHFTDKIEPLSLDEAYLDVTNCSVYQGSATLIAMHIKKCIYQQEHLIASAGVAPNKFLAKIASDWKKPNGLFVITPDEADGFVEKLSVKKIPGVGKVMVDKLEKFGLFTCKDVQNYPLIRLQENFGKMGNRLYSFARGIDVREVETTRIRKSLSVEETFAKDVLEPKVYLSAMKLLIKKLTSRLEKNKNVPIHKLFVKIKFSNFAITTVEKICDQIDINIFQQLLKTGLERHKTMPIRLLGVGVRFVEKSKIKTEQLEFPYLI